MSKLEIENLRAILNNAQKSGNTQEIVLEHFSLSHTHRLIATTRWVKSTGREATTTV